MTGGIMEDGNQFLRNLGSIREQQIDSDTNSYKEGFFNVIRWPEAQGHWWLVKETNKGYVALLELHPTSKGTEPTWNNQLWQASKLLVDKGIEALRNPHAMIGKDCKCRDCFCCAALTVYLTTLDELRRKGEL